MLYDRNVFWKIWAAVKQSGKLVSQPVGFSQRGKSTYSSARSPYLPAKLAFMPARLRMASYPACLTFKEITTEIKDADKRIGRMAQYLYILLLKG